LKNDYYFNIISYGSSSTDLDIIGSDKDYIIFYVEKIKLNEDFLSRLNKRLSEQNKFNLDIKFIPNASVPVIKLTYDLSKEIYINKIFEMYKRQYKFFYNYDCTKIKIDISSTKDHKTIENTQKMTELIKTELNNYPLIRPVVLYLKFYLKKYNMNSVYLGWLSSLAIFLMIRNIVKTYIKKNHKNDLSIGRILILFLEKFSNYNYDYIIDKDGYDIPYVQSNYDKRFIIINPLDPNKNVCESSFQTKKIKECFANMLKDIIATGEIPF
jgi:DNA polymerase sigma